MTTHPALAPGRVAVITGGASGIGLAAARRFAALGMRVVLADLPGDRLTQAEAEVAKSSTVNESGVLAVPTDVSQLDQVQALHDRVFATFGDVAVLMNNAGTDHGGGPYARIADWRRVLEVNLWGVINGTQVFTPSMLAQGRKCAIVNTGSKQGITCPPGDTAYNVSKAGVKVLTEALAHSLRNEPGAHITAHLLVPGSTFTGLSRGWPDTRSPGAWTADQVAEMLIERMNAGDFYIICPDNDVSRALDNLRMTWAMQDITENRPPLSRWHDDYKDAFAAYVRTGLAKD